MKQEINSVKIGNAIKFLRKREGYTQKELAERLSVSDKAVSKWERGIGVPDVSLLKILSIILDTDIDCILDGKVAYSETAWKGVLLLNQYAASFVYDKLFVEYLLSYFLLVSVRDIFVFCSKEQVELLSERYADGGKYGVHITYCEMLCGSVLSDELQRYKDFFSSRNLLLINGTDIVYGSGLTKFMQRALLTEREITALVLTGNNSQNKVYIDEDRRVNKEGLTASVKRNYEYSLLPFLFLAGGIQVISTHRFTCYDDLIGQLIEERKLYAEMMDRGFVSFSLQDTDSNIDASLFIRLVQNRTGLSIGDLQEIAARRGLLETDDGID